MLHHDLSSLRLFVAICELRSVSKAAGRLHIAVSAASRRLRMLETEAGIDLVKRLPHGVEPTMAGATALRYARSVLALADQFAANMEEHRGGARGRVRVFASSSALVKRLAVDLAAFAREHPEIAIDLEERPTVETVEALHRQQADIGVVVRGVPTEGLRCFPYSGDRLAIAVERHHRLAGAGRVRFAEILEEDLVALGPGSAVSRLLVEEARQLGRYMKVRVKVNSFEAMCQMVRHGLGVGILPEDAVRPLADALGLILVTLDEPWAIRAFDVCVPALPDMAPPTARLLESLRARAG